MTDAATPRDSERVASAILLGTGVVGGAVIEMVHAAPSLSKSAERSPVRIVGVANRRAVAMAGGEAVSRVEIDRVVRAGVGRAVPPIDDATLDRLAARPSPVLIDATAADGMEALYERALRRGVHVVTANKKPLVCAWPWRERLFAAVGTRGSRFGYEATVGAGMSVVETLRRLLAEGDAVRRIDCVLSGTLAFLSREIAAGTKLSRAVAIARERGYSEPDPREDLRGTDVARKLTILARELGAPIELTHVALTPFVPPTALAPGSFDALMADLADLDVETASFSMRHAARGERIVYLARIEVDARAGIIRASAGPTAVSAGHPAITVAAASAMVAFTTARHHREPLILRRAASGGRVTAAALLDDVRRALGQDALA